LEEIRGKKKGPLLEKSTSMGALAGGERCGKGEAKSFDEQQKRRTLKIWKQNGGPDNFAPGR